MSFLKQQVGNEWYNFMSDIIDEDFKSNWKAIVEQYKTTICYPDINNVFRAFKEVELDKVRVVLIAQDPYIDGVATGLCLDTNGKKITPSLRKIYEGYSKEYPHNFYTDLMDGRLHRWTEHGILMLNTALTVEAGKSGSHTKYWEDFTINLFKKFNDIDRPILYIAWGKHAQLLVDATINNTKHQIVKASHPVSAVYKNTEWNSNGSFKKIETFLNKNYDKSFKWES